ncbi:hypothetical protein V2W45_1336686 [Cenococcum geophilum]
MIAHGKVLGLAVLRERIVTGVRITVKALKVVVKLLANPVVIEDSIADLGLEAKGDKASNKAKFRKLGDGSNSNAKELPLLEELEEVLCTLIHNRTKLAALYGN